MAEIARLPGGTGIAIPRGMTNRSRYLRLIRTLATLRLTIASMERAKQKMLLSIALAVVVSGCSPPLEVVVDFDTTIPGAPEWVRSSDLTARTIAAADRAAREWGREPGDLDGWTIHWVLPEQLPGWAGWAVEDARALYVVISSAHPCPEASALAHEVGHAVGFWGHMDPRWGSRPFGRQMADAMADSSADTKCKQYLGHYFTSGLPTNQAGTP